LNGAMDSYDVWFQKLFALCWQFKPEESYLKLVIENHWKTEQEKKAKKMVSGIWVRTAWS